MDLLLDAVCVVDRDGCFLFVSAASERIFGYPPEEMVGRPVIDFVYPGDREKTLHAITEILDGDLKPYFENRYVRKDGKIAHIMWSARWSESEQIRVAVARDITEQKHAESLQAALYAISEAANASEDLPALFQRIHKVVKDLLLATNFVVALYDSDNDELSFPYVADQDGLAPDPKTPKPDDLIARVVRTGQALLMTPETAASLLPQLAAEANPDVPNWLGVPLEAASGTIGALVVQCHAGDVCYTAQDRDLLQFVAVQVAAAIERKRMHGRLEYMANHDQLTGLASRALFLDRLQMALSRARRGKIRLAVLYLDLDEFKRVNDTYGHTVGDHLLQEVARRLTHYVRESDTVGRLGGDEFIVLLDGIKQPECATIVMEKIHAVLSAPYEHAKVTLQVTSSIGVALYPEDGADEHELIRYADKDMYEAKRKPL
ncbi:MAG: diguanylate cyclase [Xanthomonadaceae bacterium]|nr:diguanylate cyclase [Xanthomonadaceae bacterium]